MSQTKILQELSARHPSLTGCLPAIEAACQALWRTVELGGTIYICGNGGSSADSEHISGELLKGFLSRRPLIEADRAPFAVFEGGEALAGHLQYGIRAVPLPSLMAASTAFANDVDPMAVYAQLLYALGKPGDSLLAISTSGNAESVRLAAVTARTLGVSVVGLTGRTGGRLKPLCNACVCVPEEETFEVQELHLPVYHALCASLEARLLEEKRA